jgi:WhiB family redox-sensing transcriptional regulator
LQHPCEANPEFWFSEIAPEIEAAKEACGFCPVREECAELGEDEEFGVWGGQSPEDRRIAKRTRVAIAERRLTAQLLAMQENRMSISAMSRELGIPRKTLADRLRRMSGLAA